MPPPSEAPVEIRVENVHKAFGRQRVLRGVTFDVHQGEIVAIVGGSGSGKTVLLEHLIAQSAPDRGRVLVADHGAPDHRLRDLATLDEATMDRIRMHWSVVFQRNALFSGSVHENIALWLRENRHLRPDEIDETARRVVRAVGFDDPAMILAKDRDDLSGGMAKRVAIARALAMDPLILFFDEPTTGLDPTHASHIHELIHATHEREREDGLRQTTIIITHDKDLLYRLRPRIIMLHDGVVYFDGPYDEFRRSESPIIRPYFEAMTILQRRPSPGPV